MSFWDKVKLFMSEVEEFLLPFIKQFLTTVGPAVLLAAEKAVLALVESTLTGPEKRDEAFKAIVKDLEAQGIQAATSTINAAIEAAVARVKAQES